MKTSGVQAMVREISRKNMRHLTLPIFLVLCSNALAAGVAPEKIAFKKFELGERYPSIAKTAGMSCTKPTVAQVDAALPKEERQAQGEANRLRAFSDGDLLCQWKHQTIAGQPVRVAKFALFDDVLMLVELRLEFPMKDLNLRRDQRTAATSEIDQIAKALAGKYGEPKQMVQYSPPSTVRDYWFLPSGEIALERLLDLPYHASVMFKTKAFETEHNSRLGAANAIEYKLYTARLQKAEAQRLKNSKDL